MRYYSSHVQQPCVATVYMFTLFPKTQTVIGYEEETESNYGCRVMTALVFLLMPFAHFTEGVFPLFCLPESIWDI